MGEPFYTNIQNVIFISNQIYIIIIGYHLMTFIVPGLYYNEYSNLKHYTSITILVFGFYLIMCYKILIPWSWDFFLEYPANQKINFYFEAKFNEYIKLLIIIYKIVIMLTFINLSLIFFLTIKKNIDSFLKKRRKYIYIFIIIVSSLITPPDILSQIFTSIFCIIIFEQYIYVLYLYTKYKNS